MRIFQLMVMLLPLLLVTATWADNYSCRDSQGRLHLADSLSNLPEECREQAKTHTSDAVDNLIYVPTPAEPGGSDIRFEHSVRDAERGLQRKQQRGEQLQQSAETLAEKYETASADRRRAKRSWNYSSRETIKKSDVLIQEAREGKQQVLQELPAAALPSREEQQIRAILDRVAED